MAGMRHLRHFEDAKAFKTVAWSLLLKREAENNLMIGIVERLATGASPEAVGATGRPGFWTVAKKGRLVAAAAVTPPHRLILTRMSRTTTDFLAAELERQGVALPGVIGPKDSAERFARSWAITRSQQVRQNHALRIYRIKHVLPVAEVPGQMMVARPRDLDLIRGWNAAFCRDAGLRTLPTSERLRQRIQEGEIVMWLDSEPRAIACTAGPTPSGIRIGMVYTPPEQRRKGYATALVTALSRHQLDSGRKFCFLFADLKNPVSNSIYQKIGYRPVYDFTEYDFVPTGG